MLSRAKLSRVWTRLTVIRLISAIGVAMLLTPLPATSDAATVATDPVQRLAENFVSLALQLGSLPGHEDEVDSYFGPDSLRPAANQKSPTVAALCIQAHLLLRAVEVQQHKMPTKRGAAGCWAGSAVLTHCSR